MAAVAPRLFPRHPMLRQAAARLSGTESVDPLEFLARVLVHIPDRGHVTTRYYGWHANRPRGMRGKSEGAEDRRDNGRVVPSPFPVAVAISYAPLAREAPIGEELLVRLVGRTC